MRFDWQTDQESTLEGITKGRHRWRLSRWQRWLLSLLGLVTLALLLLGWYASRRLEARRTALREDILASHHLWEQAIGNDDRELFRFLLARRDVAWQQAQDQSFVAGVVVDRAPFGLHLSQLAANDPQFTFAPDWQSAELSSVYNYAPDARLHLQEEVTLLQTVVYRLQDKRWVQAAPDEGFWGPIQTIEGTRLTASYPEHDAAIAQRLIKDLEADLQRSCDQVSAERNQACPVEAHVELELSTDPATLAHLPDLDTPLFNGRTMVLPTPTITGVPVDDAAYRAFYRGYMGRVLKSFETMIVAPIPLPAQSIHTLCLSYPSEGLTLHTYDPVTDVWTAVHPDRAYRFLDALPDDSGLILQETPLSAEANQLRLLLRQNNAEQLLVNDPSRQWQPRPIGWASADQPRLLLQGADLIQATTFYQLLDLQHCDETGCDVTDLSGFTVWAPATATNAGQALTVVDTTLYLADAQGTLQQPVAEGFNPFWFDEATFGFVRFAREGAQTTMELVAVETDTLQETVLFDADELAQAAGIDKKGVVFIKYATVSPTDPQLLLIAATGLGNYAGQYFIFTVNLRDDGTAVAELRLQLDNAPNVTPSLLTPTGYPPFQLSPDGRWLLVSELTDPQRNRWTFQLHNISQNSTQQLTSNFPAYPARYPFYDWTTDGQWLLIVDDGFIRLIAPEHHYQRLIPHEFDSCLFTAWAN